MAFDAFLTFTAASGSPAIPVVGETMDKAYKGAIELTSFSFGVENPIQIGSKSGGAGTGKAEFKELEITKLIDSTSPGLMQTLCMGGHYTSATLSLRASGGDPTKAAGPFAQFEMKMVFVADIHYAGSSGDEHPMETIKLRFGAIKFTSNSQAATKAGKPQEATWSQVLNQAKFDVV